MNDEYHLFCTLVVGNDQPEKTDECDIDDIKCLCAQYLKSA